MTAAMKESSVLAVSTKSRHSAEHRRLSLFNQSQSLKASYGGFESRQLETNYNKSLFATLFLFSNTLLKFFDGEKCNQADFEKTLTKLFGRLITLEASKMLPPKFSRSIGQLVKFLGIEVDEEQVSVHEASLRRLLSKEQMNQNSSEAFETPVQQQSYSLEPVRPSRYDTHETRRLSQGTHRIVDIEPQTSPRRGRKKKVNKSLPNAQMRLSKSPPKHQKSPRRDSQHKRPQSPRFSEVFNEVVKEIPGEPHRTDDQPDHAQLDYNSDELGSKTLQAYQSIHTIQEDEFNQEEDDTLHEPSRELSTGQHFIQQLDIYINRELDQPAAKKQIKASQPRLDTQQHAYEVNPIAIAGLYSPSVTDSPLKVTNLEHNEKTIKQKHELNQILAQAKKQYTKDKVKQSKQVNISTDFQPNPASKKKANVQAPSVNLQRIKPEGNLVLDKKFQAKVLPSPRIIRQQQKEDQLSRPLRQTIPDKQQVLNRKFLRKIRQKQLRNDPAEQDSDGEVQRLKKLILEQHVANQDKIRDRFSQQRSGEPSQQRSDSQATRQHSQNKVRTTLRRFVAGKKQKTQHQSLSTSVDYYDGNLLPKGNRRGGDMVQGQVNRQRHLKDANSLNDGIRLRRRLLPSNNTRGSARHDGSSTSSQAENSQNDFTSAAKGGKTTAQKKLNFMTHTVNKSRRGEHIGPPKNCSGEQDCDENFMNAPQARDQAKIGAPNGLEISHDATLYKHAGSDRSGHQRTRLSMDSQGYGIGRSLEVTGGKRPQHRQLEPLEQSVKISLASNEHETDIKDQLKHKKEPKLITLEPLPRRSFKNEPGSPIQEYTEVDTWRAMQARPTHQTQESAHETKPSSGRWRQPVGGASVGLASDCDNTLANFNQYAQDIRSQAYSVKPNMMYNTMYGSMHRRINPEIIGNDLQYPPQTGQQKYNRVRLETMNSQPRDKRNRQHVKPEVGEVEEPSLPQFPPSSMEAASLANQNVDMPVMAKSSIWKKSRTAGRNSQAPNSRRNRHESHKKSQDAYNGSNGVGLNEQQIPQSTLVKQRQSRRSSKKIRDRSDFAVTKNALTTNNSNFDDYEREDGPPVVNQQFISHYQMRLQTRGISTAAQNNNDLVTIPSQKQNQTKMNKTHQNWRTMRNSLHNGMATHQAHEVEGDVEIESGAQKYIVSQQGKRKHAYTSNARQLVNQTQSMQDRREIFSEEDFCAQDFHKFRLPQFSREHHESLFETQKLKLEQQRQAFEDKAGRSSVSIKSRQEELLVQNERSKTMHGRLNTMNDAMAREDLQFKSSRNNPDVTNSVPPLSGSQRNVSWSGKFRQPRFSRDAQANFTTESQQNPLLKDSSQALHKLKNDDNRQHRGSNEQVFLDQEGAYETEEENESSQREKPSVLRQHRLSQEVAALIADTGDDDTSRGDLDRGSDEQALLENAVGRSQEELTLEANQQLGEQSQTNLRDGRHLSKRSWSEIPLESAPDKEIFENSERRSMTRDSQTMEQKNDHGSCEVFTFVPEHHIDPNSQDSKSQQLVHFASSPPREDPPPKVASQLTQHDPPKQSMHTNGLLENHQKSSSLIGDYNDRSQRQQKKSNRSQERRFELQKSTIVSASENSDSSSHRQRRLDGMPDRIKQKVAAFKVKQGGVGSSLSKRSSSLNNYIGSHGALAILASSQGQATNSYVVYDDHQDGKSNSDNQAKFELNLDKTNLVQKRTIKAKGKKKEGSTSPRNSSLEKRVAAQSRTYLPIPRNQSQKQAIEQINPASFMTVMRRSELSVTNRKSLNEAKSHLPKSMQSNSLNSQPRLSKLSLEKRQKKQLP